MRARKRRSFLFVRLKKPSEVYHRVTGKGTEDKYSRNVRLERKGGLERSARRLEYLCELLRKYAVAGRRS